MTAGPELGCGAGFLAGGGGPWCGKRDSEGDRADEMAPGSARADDFGGGGGRGAEV